MAAQTDGLMLGSIPVTEIVQSGGVPASTALPPIHLGLALVVQAGAWGSSPASSYQFWG